MNTAVLTERIAEASPRFMARMAGVFYLMDFAFAPAMFAGSKFVVPGDAAVTATNMLAHESLFRLGFFELLEALTSGFVQVIVPAMLVVPGDAAATAANILAHELPFSLRAGRNVVLG